MGSGDRIKFGNADSFGIGASINRFPFAITINMHFLFWYLSIGFGKGYDE